MYILRRFLQHCVVTFCIELAVQLTAQTSTPPPNVKFERKTSREALLEKGISVDGQSLVIALKNSDPEIRGLAAMRLATDHIVMSSADLKTALLAETNVQASVRMAGSLFQLSPADGEPYVVSLCQNVTLSPIANISAARVLSDLDPTTSANSCGPTLEHLVNDSSVSPDDAANALSILTDLRTKLSEDFKQRVRKASIQLLTSKEFSLRAASIRWLGRDGSPEALSALSRATSTESNPALQTMMRHATTSQ